MAKRNTSIRINGKQYDAITGQLLNGGVVPAAQKPAIKSIDGVVGGTHKLPKAAKSVDGVKTTRISVQRTTANHVKAHHVKPSATLMRHAVKKPVTSSVKRRVKVQAPTHALSQLATRPTQSITVKQSVYGINQRRLQRAKAVNLSPRIARFAHELTSNTPQVVEDALIAINKAIVIPQTPTAQHIIYRPDISRVRAQKATSDIFEQALLRATSHEEPAPVVNSPQRRRALRSLRHRMVSYTAGAMAVLAIAGFFGFQNSENMQFKRATSSAGFSATLPDYQPTGYSISGVKATSGIVNVEYSTRRLTGIHTFTLAQRPTNWDDEKLLMNILATRNKVTYNTIKQDGHTIYVYGKNQAAWIDNGILYQVLGNGGLTTQDFNQFAASM